jgi:subtilisin family serine protease
MHRQTPLALLLTLALLLPAAARADGLKVKNPKNAPPGVFLADIEQQAALKGVGFEIRSDSAIAFTGNPPAVIDKDLLAKADLAISSGAVIVKSKYNIVDGAKVPPQDLVKILQGLLPFARAKSLDPAQVGAALRQWGIPAEFNGRHLLNPDGSATYFGVMFYEGMRDKQDSARKVSGERLAASLAYFDSAYSQAFDKDAPDLGIQDLQRAWALLGRSKPGETPLPLMNGAAYVSPKEWSARLSKAKGDASVIAALNQLEKTRYHQDRSLQETPPPPKGKEPARTDPPSQLSLAGILAAVDKLNGSPLSADQQEWLVKSFPMGETVWRMGAPSLWREGLTGKGVKVAVIDTGAGSNPDIDPRVKARENFTRERGQGAVGEHATHVSGTILALAPDAELRSYRVLNEHNWRENGRLNLEEDELRSAIGSAIDKAVADGNLVINMSLGGGGRPTGSLADKISKYADQGVVFVIAAGNNGAGGPDGVEWPGNMPKVVTAGSLDVDNRYSRYSSFGSVWDPANASYYIKKIFMAPGQDIASSAPATKDDPDPHQLMSGTSMATPHIAGVATLLVQEALGLGKDTKAAGHAVVQALDESSPLMDSRDLPPDAPPDQDFVVVSPMAAYKRLRAGASIPAAAK